MLEGMTYDLAVNYHRYGWHASRSGTIVLELWLLARIPVPFATTNQV